MYESGIYGIASMTESSIPGAGSVRGSGFYGVFESDVCSELGESGVSGVGVTPESHAASKQRHRSNRNNSFCSIEMK